MKPNPPAPVTPAMDPLPNHGDLRRFIVDALCSVRGGSKLPDVVIDRLVAAVATWVDMKPGIVGQSLTETPAPVTPRGLRPAREVAHDAVKPWWNEPYPDGMVNPPFELVAAVTEAIERDRATRAPGPGDADVASVARLFHETYERLAPGYGYQTRKTSALPWDDVPQANRELMMDGESGATVARAWAARCIRSLISKAERGGAESDR